MVLINTLKTLWSVLFTFIKGFSWFLIPLCIFVFVWVFVLFFIKFRDFKGAQREVIAHVNILPKESLFHKIFISLPKQIWYNYYNNPKGSFNLHGIIIFTGRQGQGKTAAETKLLNDMRKTYPLLQIYTNYGYLYESEPIQSWKDLVFKNNGQFGVICALDELQNWFSSNASKNFPPRMLATVTQNRKNHRVIIGSSHFFNNIAKPIRIHTTEIRHCMTFFKCFTIVKRTRPEFDGEGNVIREKFLGYYCFVHSEELYNSYDTYKVIENLAESGFKDDDFGVYEESIPTYRKKANKGFRGRSAVVENIVNNNIDNAMSNF